MIYTVHIVVKNIVCMIDTQEFRNVSKQLFKRLQITVFKLRE